MIHTEQAVMRDYATIADTIGNTPLVRLQRLNTTANTVLLKLEGNNPAGSVKDRPAFSMISEAERRGALRPGDTCIEATSGNTGIALAMAAAIKGYRMILVMPDNMTLERKAAMLAYGATLELVTSGDKDGMEAARDRAEALSRAHGYVRLDQFANNDNPLAHIRHTGPEIWQQTAGRITHFVSAMGTTGTITGVSQYLKQHNADIQIIGVQPAVGSRIPGIRKWSPAYVPAIYRNAIVDDIVSVTQQQAETMTRRLAREEGILAGISSGGALSAALRIAEAVTGATIVSIVCDRGDRYLSSGIFNSTEVHQ